MGKYLYRIYGAILESDIEIPYLVKAEDAADIFFVRKDFSDEEKKALTREYVVLGKDHSSFYNDELICAVEGGERVLYEPAPGADPDRIRSFLLGYGLAMLFLQRGKLAIHCSGVRMGDKAVLVSGRSGAGKSTLTRQFLEHGYKLMADDMIVAGLENGMALVYPAFPAAKLCADVIEQKGIDTQGLMHITENKDKYIVPYEDEFSCEPAELGLLCIIAVLSPEAEAEMMELRGAEKLKMLIDSLFIERSIMFSGNNPVTVALAAELASKIRVILIGRPDKKNTASQLFEIVEKAL